MLTSAPSSSTSEASEPRAWRHLPALDGLRGAAVVAVLLFHDGYLDGGFLGVDLFFALSGFLITGLLLDERQRRGGVALGAFWARRARRLLPAMLAFLVVIVPLMYLWGSPAQLESARDSVLPSLLYVVNWHQIREATDYWALFTDPSPMTHLWSLAVEEQFYIVWPLVVAMVFTRAAWRRWMFAIVIGGTVASAIAMAVLFEPRDPTRAYIGTDTRALSILLGALLALVGGPQLIERAAARSRTGVQALQIALVVGLLSAWVLVDGRSSPWLFRGGMVAHALAGAVLAASIGLANPTLVQRLLSMRWLRWFGTISYGLYLWHWPVFILLDERRTGLDGFALSLLRWSVSIAAALVSLRVVEQPIRRNHQLWTAGRSRMALGAAIALSLAMVVVVPQRQIGPSAFDPDTITVPTTSSTTAAPSTTAPTAGSTTTSIAPVPLPPVSRLIWQGDSVAFDAAPGVLAAADAAGLATKEDAIFGLGLVARPDIDPIIIHGDRIAEFGPDLVVYTLSSWDSGFPADEQRAAFDRYVAMVLETGAQLVFLTPPPVDPVWQIQDVTVMRTLAQDAAAADSSQVTFVDADAFWGPFARDMNGDGVPERKTDGVHVCPQGSAQLGAWLINELDLRFVGLDQAPPAVWASGPWTQDPRYSEPPGACA